MTDARDILAPIQIGRPVANAHVVAALCAQLGLPEPDTTDLHVTLAWSRAPVDWSLDVFAPRIAPLIVEAQAARIERFGPSGEVIAMVLESSALAARHAASISVDRASGEITAFRSPFASVRPGAVGPECVVDRSFTIPVFLLRDAAWCIAALHAGILPAGCSFDDALEDL